MTSQVLPPANGKKLWRVKRSVSTGNIGTDSPSYSSLECLNNSLKISQAAGRFSVRRPPIRRPKNRPGKPKDFVFVNLSPVKTEDAETFSDAGSSSSASSPSQSPLEMDSMPYSHDAKSNIFDLPQLNESLSSLSDNDSLLSSFNYMHEAPVASVPSSVQLSPQEDCMGLGIMNLDVQNWEQNPYFQEKNQEQIDAQLLNQQLYGYQHAMMEQYKQIQFLKSQLIQQAQQTQQAQQPVQQETIAIPSTNCHKRSKSVLENPKRRGSSQFHFKSYNGPNKKLKQMKLRRTVSEQAPAKVSQTSSSPASPETSAASKGPVFDDLMMFTDSMPLLNYKQATVVTAQAAEDYQTYNPESEIPDDGLSFPKHFDNSLISGCGLDQFLLSKQEDLFAGFVSL